MTGEQRLARLAQWVAIGALALAGLYSGYNADTFGHLAQGRQIFQLGHVPALDTWSLLPGPPRPWHNYEWLSDVVFYGLYRAFGYDGLIAFKCCLLALMAWLLLRLARHWGGDRAVLFAALTLVCVIPEVRFRLSDRPQVFGHCLAAAYLLCFTRIVDAEGEQGRRLRVRLVALVFGLHVVWVNLHGSHLLGLGITGVFALLGPTETRKTFAALLGLEALASCISPYGPHIVLDAFDHVFDRRYRQIISEWHAWHDRSPPWLQIGPALHGALLAVAAPLLARQGARLRPALGIAVALGIGCFRSIRFVADFVLLTVPMVGAGYALLLAPIRFSRVLAFYGVAFAAAFALVPWGAMQLPPYLGISHGIVYRSLPHGPGQLLQRARQQPRVFGTLAWGWPLMWEAPNARFFIDGRVPFYGPNHVALAMLAFSDRVLFDSILSKDRINAVVLRHLELTETKVMPAMLQRPGWSLSLIDDYFALFTRDDLSTASSYPRFKALTPSYHPAAVLELPSSADAQVEAELETLKAFPTAQAFRSWVLALRTLAPLRRGHFEDGFRWPRTEEDWARYREAAPLLAKTATLDDQIPIVWAMRALVEATLCNLDVAEAAQQRAVAAGEMASREGILAGHEIALRRGRTVQVAEVIHAALSRERGRGDPWLLELERGLREPPGCPTR